MNKIFSVVWNYSLGSWVVTSEFAHKKNKSGPCKGIRTLVIVTVGLSLGLLPTFAFSSTAISGGVISNSSATGNGGAPATVDFYSVAISAASGSTARNRSVAIGEASVATGDSSESFGRLAVATGTSSVAIGLSSNASGTNSVALGETSNASDLGASALGAESVANSQNST
ncbi:ESPR-type extended signal peptide-containing protein, partial [uncultured Pseudomonas sp.]|uniref:ESPR-type extended signal peptide-containing protein n=1 Tax=uncultured Pseudomonas sp. TaxID=114707 RepID=UPI0027DCA6D8